LGLPPIGVDGELCGLYLTESTVQFRDEPTETWFRTTYAANVAGLRRLADTIRPHATGSPYLANSLPQLMFEAEMLTAATHAPTVPEAVASGRIGPACIPTRSAPLLRR